MSTIAFSNKIGPVEIGCLISEQHSSTLNITSYPVEDGSDIHDHATIRPKQLTLEIADNNATQVYNDLVKFQESRQPFTIVTGLNIYSNMLIENIDATRDKDSSSILSAKITCREVVILDSANGQISDLGKSSLQVGNFGGTNSLRAPIPTSDSVINDQFVIDRVAQEIRRGDSPFEMVTSEVVGQIEAIVGEGIAAVKFNMLNQANQKFSAVLNDQRVTFHTLYSNFADRWSMDVAIDDNYVLTGRKILPGVNILKPFNYGIGDVVALGEKSTYQAARNEIPNGLVNIYHAAIEEIS